MFLFKLWNLITIWLWVTVNLILLIHLLLGFGLVSRHKCLLKGPKRNAEPKEYAEISCVTVLWMLSLSLVHFLELSRFRVVHSEWGNQGYLTQMFSNLLKQSKLFTLSESTFTFLTHLSTRAVCLSTLVHARMDIQVFQSSGTPSVTCLAIAV